MVVHKRGARDAGTDVPIQNDLSGRFLPYRRSLVFFKSCIDSAGVGENTGVGGVGAAQLLKWFTLQAVKGLLQCL